MHVAAQALDPISQEPKFILGEPDEILYLGRASGGVWDDQMRRPIYALSEAADVRIADA